jgi:hypothetical protein
MKMDHSRSVMKRLAADALTDLLGQVSTIKLKEIRHHAEKMNGAADGFTAHIDVLGRPHTLACAVKSGAQLIDLHETIDAMRHDAMAGAPDATPVLIAPYLTPEARAVCKARSAAFLDFEGNARLAVGEIFIGKQILMGRNLGSPALVAAETFDVAISTAVAPAVTKPHRNPRPNRAVPARGAIATA